MNKRLANILLVGVLFVLMLTPAYAQETWLYGIEKIPSPGALAITPNGNIVVGTKSLEMNNNSYVRMLTSRGGLIRQMTLKEHPTTIAVDASGRIMVGVGSSSYVPGEIKIYDEQFNYISSIGSGAGEFANPSGIAIDKNGLIYVADSDTSKIKIFNADGSFRSEFVRTATAVARAVAVDNLTGNIYVASKKDTGEGIIEAYDSSGAPSAFSSLGVNTIQSAKWLAPSGLAVVNSKIYMCDAYQDLIYIYGMDGVMIGSFSSPGYTIRIPADLAMSKDGLMFVTGVGSNNINVFGIDQFNYIEVLPSTLNFEAYENGSVPPVQQIVVSNMGNTSVQWSASADSSWINIDNLSGSINAGESVTLNISVNQGSLAAGLYFGKVNIQNQNGTVVSAAVKLTVKKAPVLTVAPSTLTLTAVAGSSTAIVNNLKITLSGGDAGSVWNAASDAQWMNVSPSQATAATTDAVVTVSASALAAGTYTGHVSVTSTDAIGSPSDVTVTLTVVNASSISVNSNIVNASFVIEGDNGMSYSGSGQNWSVTDVPDGTYTIKYADVPGYLTPLSETKTIASGGNISFSGEYIDLKLTKSLIVAVGSKTVIGKVGIFTPDGRLVKEFMPFGPQYYAALNVAAGDINGDGIDEIVVGYGIGSGNARMAVFNNEGVMLPGTDITPFWTGNGVKVAASDIDGDGSAELIVGNGEGLYADARIRIFKYVNGQLIDTGADSVVFKSKFGVNLAVADVDGGGDIEIVAAPGPDPNAAPIIKILKIDTSAGMGKWNIIASGSEIQVFSGNYGANVATGDLNGDNVSEIIVASGSNPKVANAMIVAVNGDGTPYGLSKKFKYSGGIEIASGDLDNDGKSEIVIDRMVHPSIIEVLSYSGQLIYKFNAYQRAAYRAKIALGQVY